MERRMQGHPEMMVSRRSIVEHPFGNLKQWLFGNARFLLRQLEGTRAEMALAVNAYNLKRAINVLGARQLMALMGWNALFSLLSAQNQTPRTSRGV
jgi:transposase